MKQKCQHLQLTKEYKLNMKKKAIEICKNLQETIKKIKNVQNKVNSKSTAYENTRASKKNLLKRKEELMTKYNLTEEDLN